MAEISGGVYSLPNATTRASPFDPATTLKGTVLISLWTSLWRRPMKRLIEYTVFSGLVMAWRLATWPTSFSPSLAKPTTDGVVRAPSWLGMTLGSLPSRMATTELVVPKSMPTILPIAIAPRGGGAVLRRSLQPVDFTRVLSASAPQYKHLGG